MRTKRIKTNQEETSYDLSISDLMAALCCIFLLFLANTIIKLNQQKAEYTAKNGIASQYRTMQGKLQAALEEKFKDMEEEIEIRPDMTIHFKNTDTLFAGNSDSLSLKFESVLEEFFPRLIEVISDTDFVDEILEIRIEGHTANNSISEGIEEDYKSGMKLSQERTRSVLFYCLNNADLPYKTIQGEDAREWIRKHTIAIGYSNSIPSWEGREASRRVEIKIKTKAESAISDIQNWK